MQAPAAAGVRAALLAAAAGTALFAFLFLADLRDGRALAFRDAGNYHLPVSRVVSAELRAGRFPFWNPMIACGTPLAANPNNYAWYPSRLLELVLPPEAALQVHFLGHWLAGGVMLALLAAALGMSAGAAAGAGAIYLLAGPSLSLLNFANLAPFLFWAPATMLAALRLRRAPGAAPAAALAACLALQATFAEPGLLLAEAIAVLAIVLAAPGTGRGPDEAHGGERRGVEPPGVAAALLWAAASAGAAIVLSAPMTVPLLELLGGSARAADTKAALESALTPLALLQLPVPQLFGDYHTLEKREYWGELFNQQKGPFFLSISLGTAAIAAAAAGVVARPRAAGVLGAAAVLGILLAMGPHFAPFRALASAEGSGWFRWPVKLTFTAALTLPLAAGIGIDALRRGRRGASAAGAGAALLMAALLAGAAAGMGGPTAGGAAGGGDGWLGGLLAPLHGAKDVPAIVAAVHARLVRAALFAAGAAVLFGVGAVTRGGVVVAVAAALLALLPALETAGPQRAVNRGTPLDVLRLDTPVLRAARGLAERGYRVHFPRGHWDAQLARAPGMPDEWWPRVRLDRELGNFYHPAGEGVPAVLLNPDRLVSAGAAVRGRIHGRLMRPQQDTMLRLIGVGGTVRTGAAALRKERRPAPTIAGYPVLLDEDPLARPIASWTSELPAVEGADPWNRDFLQVASAALDAHADPSAVSIAERVPGRWALDVDAPRDGWVTLTETRAPGWTVSVDGERVDVVPYLADFQAVAVPAGPHRVEWRYRPRGIAVLIAVAALGWIGVGWILLRAEPVGR